MPKVCQFLPESFQTSWKSGLSAFTLVLFFPHRKLISVLRQLSVQLSNDKCLPSLDLIGRDILAISWRSQSCGRGSGEICTKPNRDVSFTCSTFLSLSHYIFIVPVKLEWNGQSGGFYGSAMASSHSQICQFQSDSWILTTDSFYQIPAAMISAGNIWAIGCFFSFFGKFNFVLIYCLGRERWVMGGGV